MSKKHLIEICLNLNDGFSDKDEQLDTSWLIVMDSFVVVDDEKERFLSNNLPIILKWLMDDSKDLYKTARTIDKISKKDFVIRVQSLADTTFLFV